MVCILGFHHRALDVSVPYYENWNPSVCCHHVLLQVFQGFNVWPPSSEKSSDSGCWFPLSATGTRKCSQCSLPVSPVSPGTFGTFKIILIPFPCFCWVIMFLLMMHQVWLTHGKKSGILYGNLRKSEQTLVLSSVSVLFDFFFCKQLKVCTFFWS